MTETTQVMRVVNQKSECEVFAGTVAHYVEGDKKEFGFIQHNDSNQSVFFHHNYQRTFACNGGNVPVVINDWIAKLPFAEKDSQVVFQVEDITHPDTGMPAKRAKFWGHKASYDEAMAQIAQRYTFRLRKRTGKIALSTKQTKPEMVTLWTGKDLCELRKLFPARQHPIYDNDTSAVFFEFKVKDAKGVEIDKWEECDDPR